MVIKVSCGAARQDRAWRHRRSQRLTLSAAGSGIGSEIAVAGVRVPLLHADAPVGAHTLAAAGPLPCNQTAIARPARLLRLLDPAGGPAASTN